MPRPVTLFTGQFADLPFEEVCRLAAGWGKDWLEIACWGDHLEVDKAIADNTYIKGRRETLDRYGLSVFAISCHLTGQAVCDHPIDIRHRGILPARVWGDGDAEGVRRRAAEEVKATARAAAKLGVRTVIGFTGSSIWHTVAMFPPVPASMIDHGDAPWEPIVRMLNAIQYEGPISIEWEDAGMDRAIGAPDALAFIRRLTQIEPPALPFDAAFSSDR